MIQLINLLKEVSVEEFNKEIIDRINDEYGEDYKSLTPKEMNDGYCHMWADLFVEKFGGKRQWSFDFPNDPTGHHWVKFGNKFYDAEAPNGVDSIQKLPYIQRVIEKYGSEWMDDEFYKNIQQ